MSLFNRLKGMVAYSDMVVMLKDEGNYYIFKDNKTLIEVKLSVINDDKVTIEFKDHFE